MSKKPPVDFRKTIDFTIKSKKKSTARLSKKTKDIIEQLDKNPLPEKR